MEDALVDLKPLDPAPRHGQPQPRQQAVARREVVAAAAEFLASLGGETWLVLGDMFELGDDAARLHSDVGESIREAGVDKLFTLGELAAHASVGFGENATSYEALEPLLADLVPALNDKVNVLVKGSRGMRMERVVEALREPEPMRKEA